MMTCAMMKFVQSVFGDTGLACSDPFCFFISS